MTPPPVPSATVVRLTNGSQRAFDRFDEGVEVWHRGQRCVLANWSLGGLGLIVPDCPWDGSESIPLTLRVPLADGQHFPVPVQARLVHYTPATQYAGLRFEGLTAGSYGALRHVQDCTREQIPLTLDALHAACRMVNGPDLLLLPQMGQRSRWRWARYAGVGVLLASVLYLLGYTLKTRIFTLHAPFAAVTTPAFALNAPADGRLEILADLSAGQLHKGQPVARITDPKLVAEIETLKAEARLHTSRIRILREQEQGLRRIYARYADIANAMAKQKTAAVAAAAAQVTEHQARFRRVSALHARGLATAAAFEEAQSALLQAQAAVMQAQAAVMQAQAAREEAETNKTLASRDVLFTGSRVEGGNLQELRRELAFAEAEARNLDDRLRVLTGRREGLQLLSPCDCRIGRVLATPESWVRTGMPLLTLHSEKPEDLLIEARIPQHQADRLSIEGAAHITLPHHTAPVTGRVSVVRRTPLEEMRAGLAESLPSATAREMATVLVRVLDPLPPAAVGLPVQVAFDLRPEGWLGDVLRFVYP